MNILLYMDHHVKHEITAGLWQRGVDVLTTQQDKTERLSDAALLDRAGELGRVLFTQDKDFLIENARRLQVGAAFVGVIYGHQLRVTIGKCVRDLELLCLAGEPDDFESRVTYLPLRY